MIFISKCLLPVFSFHFRSTAYYTGPNLFLCLDYYPALAFWLRAVFTIAKSKQILWTGPRFCISLSADKKKVEVKSCAKLYIPSTMNTSLDFLAHKWGLLCSKMINHVTHGLRTPIEGINQRNLKIWAEVADKIFFGRT